MNHGPGSASLAVGLALGLMLGAAAAAARPGEYVIEAGSAPVLNATVSGASVTMGWTVPAGARSYALQAGSASGRNDIASVAVGATPGLVAKGIGAGTYYVRVVASNACGAGAPSAERVVTVR